MAPRRDGGPQMTMIPTLHTERLTLRAWREADFPTVAAFFASKRSGFVGGPHDGRLAWRRLASWVGHWRLRGDGGWAMVERATGTVVGYCGVAAWPGKPEPEIGWLAFGGGEGRGFVAEAARAALAFVRDDLGWTRAVSYIAPGNTRSVALAVRLGATDEGSCPDYRGPSDGAPHHTWRHDLSHAVPAERGRPTTLHAIPMIETERLRLRAFEPRDIEPMVAFYADRRTAPFVGGHESHDQVWRRVASYLGHWDLRGYGIWALEERATGRFVGYAGHWFPEGWLEPEIAYGLLADHHGRGFATEAAEAALRHAYERLGWRTAISAVDVGNTASQRVSERLGAVREDVRDMSGFRAAIYRHRPPADLLAA